MGLQDPVVTAVGTVVLIELAKKLAGRWLKGESKDILKILLPYIVENVKLINNIDKYMRRTDKLIETYNAQIMHLTNSNREIKEKVIETKELVGAILRNRD